MIDDDQPNLLHILKNFEFPNRMIKYEYPGEIKIYFSNFLCDKNFESFYSYRSIHLFNIFIDTLLYLEIYSLEIDEIISDDDKTFLLYPDEFINIGLFKLNNKESLKL